MNITVNEILLVRGCVCGYFVLILFAQNHFIKFVFDLD